MKATETDFLKFLNGTKQFQIPIYQRTYSWTVRECAQLWADICHAATDERVSGHFVGSIVHVQDGLYHPGSVPSFLVIDGQQRLTTLMLLIGALAKAIDGGGGGEISGKKIRNYCLFNSDEDGDLRFKLLLTQGDKDTMCRLLEGREMPANAATRIVENHQFFEEQIRLSSLSPAQIYRGVGKLIIVNIALDRQHDNPQLIFESLNSTGLDLTQADLIRNFVLMGLEPKQQERIYQDSWFPMEQSFGAAGYASHFDRFMRDYLTIKNRQIPNISEVYTRFKAYAGRQPEVPTEALVSDIYRFSKYFVRLAFGAESDPALHRALKDLNTLKVEVAYPFLMELYDDFTAGLLGREDLIAIIRLVESYVFRRAICGIPTNALNKVFATLGREIDRSAYLESVQEALLSKDGSSRLPRDEEFRREIIVKNVYEFRSRNYLLSKLENHERKEAVVVESYTIEHVLPQNPNLSHEWQADLGPDWKAIQERWLHTLGNLTLTGYNAELSDRSFQQKRDMPGGFKESPLRLNHDLARLNRWTEPELQERAARLAEKACDVWPIPVDTVPRRGGEVSAADMLDQVFSSESELASAKALFQEAVSVLEPSTIPRLTSISFRDGDALSLVIGAWVALRIRRSNESFEMSFLVDSANQDDWAQLKIGREVAMQKQWTGGRAIKVVVFNWKLDQPLPGAFMKAWRTALEHAAMEFKNWAGSIAKKYHQPVLAEALLERNATEPHYENLTGPLLDVYEELRKRILNLDAEVREEKKKLYIAFKAATNFVDIVPQRSRLRLSLNMPFSEIQDPLGLCKDVSSVGRWGNGDVEIGVSSLDDIERVVPLIEQALEWQMTRESDTRGDDESETEFLSIAGHRGGSVQEG